MNIDQQSCMGYEGIVTIKECINGKVVNTHVSKNAGSNKLWRALATSLVGRNASSSMPNFINLYSGSSPLTPLLTNKAYITDRLIRDESTNDGCYAQFTALVDSSSFNSSSVTITKLRIFSGFNDNDESYLAETEPVSAISIASGVSLVIVWKMIIKNA